MLLLLPSLVFHLHRSFLTPGPEYFIHFGDKFILLAFPKPIVLYYCPDSVAQNPKNLHCKVRFLSKARSTGCEHSCFIYYYFFVLKNFTVPGWETLRTNDLVSSTDKFQGGGGRGLEKDRDKVGTNRWRKIKETYQPIKITDLIQILIPPPPKKYAPIYDIFEVIGNYNGTLVIVRKCY